MNVKQVPIDQSADPTSAFFIDSYKYTQAPGILWSRFRSLASRLCKRGMRLGARVPGDGAFGFEIRAWF